MNNILDEKTQLELNLEEQADALKHTYAIIDDLPAINNDLEAAMLTLAVLDKLTEAIGVGDLPKYMPEHIGILMVYGRLSTIKRYDNPDVSWEAIHNVITADMKKLYKEHMKSESDNN